MKRRSTRGAIIAVLLLGLLIFGIVYYAWNTVTSIFQPVDAAGQGRVIPIQIRKGESTAQIAHAFAEAGLVRFNEQDFLKYALHPGQFPDAGKYSALKLIPQGHSMEGLLFPATYDIPIDGNARDVMNRMLTTFNDNVQKNGLVAMAKAHGLNEYQMVILASIVQREVLNNSDAPGVAD